MDKHSTVSQSVHELVELINERDESNVMQSMLRDSVYTLQHITTSHDSLITKFKEAWDKEVDVSRRIPAKIQEVLEELPESIRWAITELYRPYLLLQLNEYVKYVLEYDTSSNILKALKVDHSYRTVPGINV